VFRLGVRRRAADACPLALLRAAQEKGPQWTGNGLRCAPLGGGSIGVDQGVLLLSGAGNLSRSISVRDIGRCAGGEISRDCSEERAVERAKRISV